MDLWYYKEIWAASSDEAPLNMRKNRWFTSSCACAKYDPGHCSKLICSMVSIDSVNGQWRPWSDCADAQADLGLCCPHMPEDTFSRGTAHLFSDTLSDDIVVKTLKLNSTCKCVCKYFFSLKTLLYYWVFVISLLTLSTLGKIFSRRHFDIVFLFFTGNGFDISCKLSPLETICMKCQILFTGKNKKIEIIC